MGLPCCHGSWGQFWPSCVAVLFSVPLCVCESPRLLCPALSCSQDPGHPGVWLVLSQSWREAPFPLVPFTPFHPSPWGPGPGWRKGELENSESLPMAPGSLSSEMREPGWRGGVRGPQGLPLPRVHLSNPLDFGEQAQGVGAQGTSACPLVWLWPRWAGPDPCSHPLPFLPSFYSCFLSVDKLFKKKSPQLFSFKKVFTYVILLFHAFF